MAKEKAKPAQKAPEPVAVAKPKKTKLIILIVVAVLLLVGGGLAAWFIMGSGGKKNPDSRHKEEKEKVPVFVTLERFTVNLPSADGADHYLMIVMDIKVEDQKAADSVKLHMPEIRNGLLLLFSSKNVEGLATVDGKKKLSADIVKQVNEPLHLKEGEKVALDALFSEFVIQ